MEEVFIFKNGKKFKNFIENKNYSSDSMVITKLSSVHSNRIYSITDYEDFKYFRDFEIAFDLYYTTETGEEHYSSIYENILNAVNIDIKTYEDYLNIYSYLDSLYGFNMFVYDHNILSEIEIYECLFVYNGRSKEWQYDVQTSLSEEVSKVANCNTRRPNNGKKNTIIVKNGKAELVENGKGKSFDFIFETVPLTSDMILLTKREYKLLTNIDYIDLICIQTDDDAADLIGAIYDKDHSLDNILRLNHFLPQYFDLRLKDDRCEIIHLELEISIYNVKRSLDIDIDLHNHAAFNFLDYILKMYKNIKK